MRISFFEEFPTEKNLIKLSLVDWPTTLYLAAKSIKEFARLQSSIKRKGLVIGYWPVLEQEEGYWLSPFSSPRAVQRIINEVRGKNYPVMWDAELPFRRPWLFLRLDYFLRNGKRIRRFIKEQKYVLTAEYPVRNRFFAWLFRLLGVYFSPKKYGNKKIVMYYTSMHKKVRKYLLKSIGKLVNQYGADLQVGLGTIAVGVLGDEPILSAANLERDLQDMKNIGVEEVVIFRLGGLNKEYVKVLKKFV